MPLALRPFGMEIESAGIPDARWLIVGSLRERVIYSSMSLGIFSVNNGFPDDVNLVNNLEKASQ